MPDPDDLLHVLMIQQLHEMPCQAFQAVGFNIGALVTLAVPQAVWGYDTVAG